MIGGIKLGIDKKGKQAGLRKKGKLQKNRSLEIERKMPQSRN